MLRAEVVVSAALGMSVVFPPPVWSQNLIRPETVGGTVQLIPTDEAVLDNDEIKKDLPCTVTPVKPILGFDLRFHSGYDIAVPFKELAGAGNELTILFRVTRNGDPDNPAYFSQHYSVPPIDDDASGDAYLDGGFDLGEGKYHVSWMMHDRQERVCSFSWDAEASLNPKDQQVKLPIAPGRIDAQDDQFFNPEPPVVRQDTRDALKVKILVNFEPQESYAAAMPAVDESALVSILRNISREPRICKFSIVAFNMNEQRVVYRKDDLDQIDFPDLGKALGSIKPGMIEYRKLADPHSETEFLTNLMQQELSNTGADAVIFTGPKVMLQDSIPLDGLTASVNYPIFYLNYNLTPQQVPWRDAIGNVVKHFRGFEYTISRPRDLWTSWSDVMEHMAKLKLVSARDTSPK